MSQMNELLYVDQGSRQATVQTGIKIDDLQEELKKHGLSLSCLPLEGTDLNQVIANDSLCIESRRGSFKKNIEKIDFFTGDGKEIHNGGYSVNGNFGVDL